MDGYYPTPGTSAISSVTFFVSWDTSTISTTKCVSTNILQLPKIGYQNYIPYETTTYMMQLKKTYGWVVTTHPLVARGLKWYFTNRSVIGHLTILKSTSYHSLQHNLVILIDITTNHQCNSWWISEVIGCIYSFWYRDLFSWGPRRPVTAAFKAAYKYLLTYMEEQTCRTVADR